jgi:hypothetical protein
MSLPGRHSAAQAGALSLLLPDRHPVKPQVRNLSLMGGVPYYRFDPAIIIPDFPHHGL